MTAIREESGFDFGQIGQRLHAFTVGSADHRSADELQRRVIRPHLDAIVRAICNAMRGEAFFAALIGHDPSVPTFVRRLSQHLLSFGIDFDTSGYFEMRLRTGAEHARTGVSFATCTWVAAVLQRTLLDYARRHGGAQSEALGDFVGKITLLDLSLLADGYRHADAVSPVHETSAARSQSGVWIGVPPARAHAEDPTEHRRARTRTDPGPIAGGGTGSSCG